MGKKSYGKGRGRKTLKGKVMSKGGISRKDETAADRVQGFRGRFLEKLVTRKFEVEETLRQLMGRNREYRGSVSSGDFVEELDHAEREMSNQTHYKFLERKNRELLKIEMLIGRVMKEEDFGKCEDCEKKIPAERLFIVPDATRCVPCQQEDEKWELRKGILKMAHPSSREKPQIDWDITEDLDDDETRVSLDQDRLSILDFEETELEMEPNEGM